MTVGEGADDVERRSPQIRKNFSIVVQKTYLAILHESSRFFCESVYKNYNIQLSSILTSPSPSGFFVVSMGCISSAPLTTVLIIGLPIPCSSEGLVRMPSPGFSSPFWIFSRSFSISLASSTISPVPIFPKCCRC